MCFCIRIFVRIVDWDIKIVDYIEKNMSNTKIFVDIRHLSNAVYQYIALKIGEMLGIKKWKSENWGG